MSSNLSYPTINIQMKSLKIITFAFILLSYLCSSSTTLTWATSIQGTWRQSLVIAPIGPCQPCQYSLSFDFSQAKFEIYNQANKDIIQIYKLQKTSEEGQVIFINRKLHYTGYSISDNTQRIDISLQINPQSGVIYNYIVEIQAIALYIEDTEFTNTLITPIKSVLFALFLSLLIPIKRSTLENNMVETHKRVCLVTLYLYTQVIVVITAIMAITAIQYVYYNPYVIGKIILYMVLGPCFLACLIHATYNIAIVQNNLNQYLPRNTLYKFSTMFLAIFVGLIGYPLFLATFSKGMWFFYFSSVGLIVQFAVSYYSKLMPYNKFIIINAVSLIFLAVQADSYPVLNFHQLSILSMIIFALFLGGVLAGGAFFLRKTGHLQSIAAMFDISTKKPTDSTETEQSEQHRNNSRMKSDIELEDGIAR